MRKNRFLVVFLSILCAVAFAADGWGADLGILASRLARQAEDLALDGYRGFNVRERGNRSDVEILFIVQQFSAGAGLLRRMIEDKRPVSELRSACELLKNQSRDFSLYPFGRQRSVEVQRILDDMLKELRLAESAGYRREENSERRLASPRRDVPSEDGSGVDRRDRRPPSTPEESGPSGRMTWKGMVDNEAHVQITGSRVFVQIISGQNVEDMQFHFTAPLPGENTVVSLKKVRGRGSVQIFEQPSRINNYQAVVRIQDPKSGSDLYEFELSWH